MARINIEEKWWNDPRRRTLRILLGRDATEQVVVNAWRTACDYWCAKNGCHLVPGEVFIHFDGWKELILSDLAYLYNIRLVDSVNFRADDQHSPTRVEHNPTDPNTVKQCYVYLAGLRDSFSNFIETRQKKSLAGQNSAKRPRDDKGRLLSKSGKNPTNTNTHPTQSNTHQLSVSSSVSNSIKEEELKAVNPSLLNVRPLQKSTPLVPNGQHSSPLLPEVGKFIGIYVKAYQVRYKSRPNLTGKVQGQIKNLLKDIPLERATDLIQTYLQMDGQREWFKTKGHDFTTFVENLNPISIAFDNGRNDASFNWDQVWSDHEQTALPNSN